MPDRPFTPVPVTLILKDTATGREVAIPTGEVWLSVENQFDEGFHRNLMRTPRLISQQVTIEADFFRMQERMNTPQQGIESRKEIEG